MIPVVSSIQRFHCITPYNDLVSVCTVMRYLAPRCIGSAGPKTADNAGAEMVLPCRKWPPLEFAEVEQLP